MKFLIVLAEVDTFCNTPKTRFPMAQLYLDILWKDSGICEPYASAWWHKRFIESEQPVNYFNITLKSNSMIQ